MTVAELRKALEGVPDEMPVLAVHAATQVTVEAFKAEVCTVGWFSDEYQTSTFFVIGVA